MTNALDDFVVIGPNFYQKTADQLMVTPAGGVQQTLASALATAGGEEYAAGVGIDITGTLISNLVPALVAGSNITINGTVISAASGGSNYVAGGGISITGTTIATSGTGTFTTLNVNNGVVAIQNSPTSGTYFGQNTGSYSIANPGSAGVQNTFIGANAGQFSGTLAAENTFVGSLAGVFNVIGHQNAFIGCGAGWHENTSFNVGLGSDSYRNWVSLAGQGNNTALGFATMVSGGGYQNTAVGSQSLEGNAAVIVTSGTPTAGDVITLTFTGTFTGSPHNVVVTVGATPTLATVAASIIAAVNADTTLGAIYPVGLQLAAGIGISTVIDTSNVLVAFAGTGTTGVACIITAAITGTTVLTITNGATGNSNIAIGYQAMFGNYATTASANIAMGQNTLRYITTGTNNVAMGANTGDAITTGQDLIYIGAAAGGSSTTGQHNIAMGLNALTTNVTGGSHIAIGSAALRYNTAGSANTAVGVNAMAGPSAGSTAFNSAAFGFNAAAVLGNTNSVTAIGYSAGAALTTGGQNTLLGSNSGLLCTTATKNVIIGDSAASALLTGSNNVVIGSNVAKTLMTGAQSGNILIGSDTNTDTAASNVLLIQGQGGVSVPVISSTAINTAVPITILGGITGVAPTVGLVAHAGGGQGSATVLVTGANLVATVATTADSVRLPATATANNGVTIMVTNGATNAMQLFTTGSDTINTIAGSTGISIAGGKTGYFTTYATGAWFGGVLT